MKAAYYDPYHSVHTSQVATSIYYCSKGGSQMKLCEKHQVCLVEEVVDGEYRILTQDVAVCVECQSKSQC